MNYIIHHDDLDGISSAAIYYLCADLGEMEFIKIDHGDEFDTKKFKEGDTIAILDFSFKPEIMLELQEIVGEDKMVWIDHHKSAIDDANKAGLEIRGLQEKTEGDCKKSGAWLVWEYFNDPEEVEVPAFVEMVSAFDVWDKDSDYYMNGLYLNCLFRTFDETQTDPTFTLYEKLIEDNDNDLWIDILEKGETVFNFIKATSKEIVEKNSQIVEWEGMKCLVGNCSGNGSLSFLAAMDIDGKATEEQYEDIEALITFIWAKDKWTCGMYHGPKGKEKNLDLSLIAKKHDGGGHPGACGFKLKELPW